MLRFSTSRLIFTALNATQANMDHTLCNTMIMKFSRSFLSSAGRPRARAGKTSLRTLINYFFVFMFIFAVGMSITMLGLGLSVDASDSIAFAINEDGNDVNIGDFWDVVSEKTAPVPQAGIINKTEGQNGSSSSLDVDDDKPVSVRYADIIKNTEGRDGNSTTWKLVDWNNPISKEEESKFNCSMVPFIPSGSSTASETQICVHTFHDLISNTIRDRKHWGDCNVLPELWHNADIGHKGDDNSYYVEVGANIGACVLEMLLSTNATILAFEPHPMNVYNIKKTISQLDKSFQDRLMLFPIGLGESTDQSTIHSANGNMGNSVVGRVITDDEDGTQQFPEELQFTTHIERFDSILNLVGMDIRLMKMDAQGFECKILQGMGQYIPMDIKFIKTEFSTRFLKGQGCLNLVQLLYDFGFTVYRNYYKLFPNVTGKFSWPVTQKTVGMKKGRHLELYALKKT